MKQDILCPNCAEDTRNRFVSDEPFPGEFLKFVHGIALYRYFCDTCGRTIDLNSKCTAFSIWTNLRPFVPWESGYIKIQEEED
jgi:hypothetical protein